MLDSLVVEEVHHGRWTFGVCWDSPWYQTMPDQLVLRLRRIGITATLSMRAAARGCGGVRAAQMTRPRLAGGGRL